MALDPFLLFPEEVWEMILGNLESSKEILDVFKVFPQLERRVMKNKYRWLIDQVTDLVEPWLDNTNELLSCRLVSKRWCRAVDAHMEEHCGRFSKLYEEVGELTKFMEEVEKHPPGRNPFVGRGLSMREFDEGGVLLNLALEVVRKFGEHLWFLELETFEMEDSVEYCQLVLDCLSCLPNLKSIAVGQQLGTDSDELKEFFESRRGSFPVLSNLKHLSFMFDDTPTDLVCGLLTCYGPQIQILSVDYKQWRREYSNLFPKLTDLTLFDGMLVEVANDILLPLDAPDLNNLEIELELTKGTVPGLGQFLLSWLKPFPRINSVDVRVVLADESDSESESDEDEEVSVVEEPLSLSTESNVSLKSIGFRLQTESLNFDFLRCFPSLESIEIAGMEEPTYFQNKNIYDLDLWEVLPGLKEFEVKVGGPDPDREYQTFTRARYEWLKKENEQRAMDLPNPEDDQAAEEDSQLSGAGNGDGDEEEL